MKNEFVPYNLAIQLEELGFDEPCLATIDQTEYIHIKGTKYPIRGAMCYMDTPCPTFSQAFRWFREKYNVRHNIMDFIDDEVGIEWDYEIATIGTDLDENGNYKPLVDYSTDDKDRKFKTYEEAELACLIKLIEIVKDEK